ncbi:hypothetical protein [Arenimonas sp.]|uniref:hypothetical protein n=1 Tax=Arenimonas sp. TaxID=1872635 RepID=UPI0039E3C8DD
MTGGMLVPFFAIANMGVYDDRSDRLNAAVSGYERGPVLEKAFEQAVATRYPALDIDARLDLGKKHTSDRALVKQAEADGFRYLMVFEDDFTGVHTIDTVAKDDKVSVLSQGQLRLFDVKSGKSLFKTPVMAYSLERQPLQTAIENSTFFVGQYPQVAEALVVQTFSELYRTDLLHAMLETIGRGDEVPAIKSLLARYEGPINIDMVAPPGWHGVDMKTRYSKVVEPNDDLRFKLGVRADVDLLLPELGQKVDSLDQYAALAAGRLSSQGYDPASMALYEGDLQPGLEGYVAYVIRRQTGGGGQIMYLKRLDDTYLSVVMFIATENMDALISQHKANIEAALRGSTVSIRQADG